MGPVFKLTAADDMAATFFKGDGFIKVFPFGEAPEGVTPPYAVHQTISGSPVNMLSGRPQKDYVREQVDVYGNTQEEAFRGYKALEHALELKGYITGLNEFAKQQDTNRWRASFDFTYYNNH